jgi:hypothetical protein
MTVYGGVRAMLKVMVVPGGADEEGGVEAFEAEPSDLEDEY